MGWKIRSPRCDADTMSCVLRIVKVRQGEGAMLDRVMRKNTNCSSIYKKTLESTDFTEYITN